MTHVPMGATRAEKKKALEGIIREALREQRKPTRTMHFPVADFAFQSRVNQSYWRQSLADVLAQTEALELLAEMVGAIDEEVE